MNSYKFLGKAMVRTSSIPYDNKSLDYLKDEMIKEGLFIASPSFFTQFYEEGKNNLQKSLANYENRLKFNPTPFGLFSPFLINRVQSSIKNEHYIIDSAIKKKRVSLDFSILYEIYETLVRDEELLKTTTIHLNSTVQRKDDKLSFIDFSRNNLVINYTLSTVEYDDTLMQILNYFEEGLMMEDGINKISKDLNIDKESLKQYLILLIQNNLLITNLFPILIGEDYFQYLAKVLIAFTKKNPTNTNIHKIATCISKIWEGINVLNTNETPKFCINTYLMIQNELYKMGVQLKDRFVFCAEAMRNSTNNLFISRRDKSVLLEITELLNRMFSRESKRFNDFKKEFGKNYGEASVPLQLALDPIKGLGYFFHNGKRPSLLNGFQFATQSSGDLLSKVENYLLSKVIQIIKERKKVIFLNKREILHLFTTVNNDSALSLNMSFSKYYHEGSSILIFNGAFGGSAINMINRFSYLSREVKEIVDEIFEEEQKLTNQLNVEVSNIQELRMANIANYPSSSTHEIPLLYSTKPTSNQINLNDLFIKKNEHDEIILFSAKLQQPIIPRLLNAVNYDMSSTPILRFLADLQNKKLGSGIYFDWGKLEYIFDFLPRIQYKNVIISPATWIIDVKKEAIKSPRDLIVLFEKYDLPSKIILNDNGKDFLFDINDKDKHSIIVGKIKQKSRVKFMEVVHTDESFVKDKNDYNYTHEIIIPIIKDEANFQSYSNTKIENIQKNYNFIPGSEWLYFKLYINESFADELLTNEITPLLNELFEVKILKSWFFIRYFDDGGFHLRVRLKINDVNLTIAHINKYLGHLLNSKIIFDIKYEVYKPERNKYNIGTMEQSETLFHLNSDLVLTFLHQNYPNQIKWMFALYYIDYFLDKIGFTLTDKYQFSFHNMTSFNNEFNLKGKQKSINIKKKHDYYINNISNYVSNFNEIIAIYEEALIRTLNQIKLKEEELENKKYDFIWCHLHMFCIRLFRSMPRKQEAILYFILNKEYKNQINEIRYKHH